MEHFDNMNIFSSEKEMSQLNLENDNFIFTPAKYEKKQVDNCNRSKLEMALAEPEAVPELMKNLVKDTMSKLSDEIDGKIVKLLLIHSALKENHMLQLLHSDKKPFRLAIRRLRYESAVKSYVQFDCKDDDGNISKNVYFLDFKGFYYNHINKIQKVLTFWEQQAELCFKNDIMFICYHCHLYYFQKDLLFALLELEVKEFRCHKCNTKLEKITVEESETEKRKMRRRIEESTLVMELEKTRLESVKDWVDGILLFRPDPASIVSILEKDGYSSYEQDEAVVAPSELRRVENVQNVEQKHTGRLDVQKIREDIEKSFEECILLGSDGEDSCGELTYVDHLPKWYKSLVVSDPAKKKKKQKKKRKPDRFEVNVLLFYHDLSNVGVNLTQQLEAIKMGIIIEQNDEDSCANTPSPHISILQN